VTNICIIDCSYVTVFDPNIGGGKQKLTDMKEVYENHHVLPVSTDGFDWEENIIRVSQVDHTLIHKTLDIPYSKLRTFRLRTNHMVHKNSQEFVRELRKVHLSFFANLGKLPQRLQDRMRDSIRSQVQRLIREYKLELKTPAYDSDLLTWLENYHYALLLR